MKNERRIVELIFNRQTDKQIAKLLDLSPKTIEKQRRKLYESLGAKNLEEALREATRRGMTILHLPRD